MFRLWCMFAMCSGCFGVQAVMCSGCLGVQAVVYVCDA